MPSLQSLVDDDPEFVDERVATKEYIALTVGAAMRRARERANLTQHDVAATLRCPQSAIARFEAGRTSPRIDTIARMAGAVGADLSLVLAPTDHDDDAAVVPLTSNGRARNAPAAEAS